MCDQATNLSIFTHPQNICQLSFMELDACNRRKSNSNLVTTMLKTLIYSFSLKPLWEHFQVSYKCLTGKVPNTIPTCLNGRVHTWSTIGTHAYILKSFIPMGNIYVYVFPSMHRTFHLHPPNHAHNMHQSFLYTSWQSAHSSSSLWPILMSCM